MWDPVWTGLVILTRSFSDSLDRNPRPLRNRQSAIGSGRLTIDNAGKSLAVSGQVLLSILEIRNFIFGRRFMNHHRSDRTRFFFASVHAVLIVLILSAACSDEFKGGRAVYDVRGFGAKGDGETLDTQPIQNAIHACAENGGGTIFFPAGTFLSGTLYLKSNVTLELSSGSTLLGSKDLNDYPPTVQAFRSYTDNYTDKSLIYGENLENIAIVGRGVIDGQGASFKGPYKVRPYLIRFVTCRNVSVRDITLKDSPMWVQHYLACDDVNIRGITVRSRCNGNNDGINIDCCHRVRISDCDIWSGDDSIVLKSTANRACENVTVTNCVLSSLCNALKLGTESNGGFRNVAVSNCSIYDTNLAGIALEIVDGGTLEQVVISGMAMRNVGGAIFLRLGDRGRPFKDAMARPAAGALRNVTISNVEAAGVGKTGNSITGLPGHPVENVTLSDIRISVKGRGTKDEAKRVIEEKPEAYPEYSMFGTLPAYGFYCRHVKGLTLRDIRLDWEEPDRRHSLVLEDVEDAEVDGVTAAGVADGSSVIRMRKVRNVFLRGCRVLGEAGVFFSLEGTDKKEVVIGVNDLSGAKKAWDIQSDTPIEAP